MAYYGMQGIIHEGHDSSGGRISGAEELYAVYKICHDTADTHVYCAVLIQRSRTLNRPPNRVFRLANRSLATGLPLTGGCLPRLGTGNSGKTFRVLYRNFRDQTWCYAI